MPKTKIKTPLFVAIDTADLAQAKKIAQSVAPITGAIKLGLEFFVHHGPAGIRHVVDGLNVALFLDLKFHDIPNTVAGAVAAATTLRPTFLTVHTAGGEAMMMAAREAADETSRKLKIPRPLILGVTVLTSLNDDDLKMMGHMTPTTDQVRRFALLAQDCRISCGEQTSPSIWQSCASRA
ncbi:MAG TPA: orotidine-5'-phosphate decarboxylase, partial [Rhodospirillaceae bacterium]|nr:orotidine-5'-phosphate decarboxylase [Rhodospirillaceae bacterium]